MSWHPVFRPGGTVWGLDQGVGMPVLFQHGLGSDESQVAEVFPHSPSLRRLTVDCRAHGRSDPFSLGHYSIEAFADDALAFADARGLERFVVGGISMGAAIALHLAIRAPDRVTALVLARPAWLWECAPPNMQPFARVADMLVTPDFEQGRRHFEKSALAAHLAEVAPADLESLLKFFERKNRYETARLLFSISASGPRIAQDDLGHIGVPTLIIANGRDYVHPLEYGRILAQRIPGAHFAEVTPKATSKERHLAEMRGALARFFAQRHA